LVVPLLTTSSGTKFGKTEAGTIWLDPQLTSPYRFSHFWFNTDDRDVIGYLKSFTFLSQSEIEELANKLTTAPEKRDAQRTLARNVTRLVHGGEELAKAERAAQILFGAEISELSVKDVMDIFADVPSSEIAKSKIDGMSIVDLLTLSGLASSKSDARRLIQSGGANLNNRRVQDVNATVSLAQAIDGQVLILRKGAKQYHVVKIID
jgi:tyrosyl-tRNA synthetase